MSEQPETLQYTVGDTPIRFNGKRYAPGEAIVLDDRQAARLRRHVGQPRPVAPTEQTSPASADAGSAAGGAIPGTNTDADATTPEAEAEGSDAPAGQGKTRSRVKKD